MGGPDPVVFTDGLPVAERLHPIEIGTHPHPPADRAGMHRVVVAVQADVVIPTATAATSTIRPRVRPVAAPTSPSDPQRSDRSERSPGLGEEQ